MGRIAMAAWVLLAATLSGCGAQPVPSPAPATLVVGEAMDSARTTVRPGDTIELRLTESRPVPGSSLTWDAASTDPGVLARVSVRREPAQVRPVGENSYIADFRASGRGSAMIRAVGATTCEAMAKMACPDRSFSLTVIVT